MRPDRRVPSPRAGLEPANALEQRAVSRHVIEAQKARKGRDVDAAVPGQDRKRRQLRRKGDASVALAVQKRLFAEPVARQEQRLIATVRDAEREHAHESPQQVRAPLGVAVQQDLGVGLRGEGSAARLELGAKRLEVVDFAVVHNDVAPVRRRHGLGTRIGEIDNREPPVPQEERVLVPVRAVVRPAVSEEVGQAGKTRWIGDYAVAAEVPPDAAHLPYLRRRQAATNITSQSLMCTRRRASTSGRPAAVRPSIRPVREPLPRWANRLRTYLTL